MNAGAAIAIIVVIAAGDLLMMRFREPWLAKINIVFTNRITSVFARRLRGSAFSRTWVVSQGMSTELSERLSNVERLRYCA
jgi:hypothetical protein